MASLAGVLAGELRRRGVEVAIARLSAEAGVVVFRVSFDRWVTAGTERDIRDVLRETLDELPDAIAR